MDGPIPKIHTDNTITPINIRSTSGLVSFTHFSLCVSLETMSHQNAQASTNVLASCNNQSRWSSRSVPYSQGEELECQETLFKQKKPTPYRTDN